eukprot:jgi/Chrzof1/1874/Cz10g24150.t1
MSWSPERQVKAGAFVPFLPTPEAQEELEPGAVQKFVEALFQFRPHIQVDSPRDDVLPDFLDDSHSHGSWVHSHIADRLAQQRSTQLNIGSSYELDG